MTKPFHTSTPRPARTSPLLLGAAFLILLSLAALACSRSLPGLSPTATPGVALDPFVPITATVPPATPTITPTPTPAPTPTPLPGVRIDDGDHAVFNGDWEAALRAYQEALDTSSDPEIQAAALVGLGRAYSKSGDPVGALEALRRLIETYPESPHCAEAFFYLAQTYEGLERYADAADAYLNYILLRPGVIDAYIYERRGDALFASNQFGLALADYQAVLQSPRLEANLAMEIKMARAYAMTGDSATALVMYDDIYQRSPNEYIKAQVDYLKGYTLASLGETENANQAYLDAVNNFPAAYDSYLALVELVNAGYPVDELQRGLVDYYARQYGVALEAFNRYLENAPQDPATAYYFKGMTLLYLDDPAWAIDMWDTVITGYPSSSVWDRAWEQKAYIQWAYLGQYKEAIETLTSFTARVPQHSRAAEFMFDAASAAERSADLATAQALWEQTAANYPQSSYAYRALFLAGVTAYRRGDPKSAQGIFLRTQAITENAEERSGALLWIGKTHQALGDSAAALNAWQQAAAQDPTGYYSERARDLTLGRSPFESPAAFDLGYDRAVEQQEAEAWLRTTFFIPAETDFSGPGELANSPAFQRGQELWRLGLYAEATNEFEALRLSVIGDPANCYRLAKYLAELGVYRPAILAARQVLDLANMNDAATLAAPMWFNRIRFGAYYQDIIIPTAQKYEFHPLFVWSLMRQESFFDREIRSSADARGLMQIIPPTGLEVANRMGWPPNYTQDDLYRPLVSIKMGLRYLYDQRNYLGGDLYTALAAYNGGPGNASIWKELGGGDPDLFLETIRLDEPRRYIKGIYEIYSIYRRLYERTP